MHMRSASVLALIFAFSLAVAASAALAAPGHLDSSFDLDGRVTTDLGSPDEEGYAVAIQPDGKLLMLARTQDTDTFVTTFFLLRYDSTGAPDTTFDGDGRLVITGPASDVAVQSDGMIVLGGSVLVDLGGSVSSDFAVARLNSDGTPDTTFSDDGLATADFDGHRDGGAAIALQADGKIVVAGGTGLTSSSGNFAVARFNDDGTLDTSFAGDGTRATNLFGREQANEVAVEADGKIVLGGRVPGKAFEDLDFGLARYNSDGTPDMTFSGDGVLRTNFSHSDSPFGLALQADGKIVAAGAAAGPSGSDFALARYKLGGKLDPTFSKDGKLRTDFNGGNDQARAVVIQANGRIVLVGWGAPPGTSSGDFALARYRTGGKLDLSFSGDGKQLTPFGSGDKRREDQAYDAALQANGGVIAAGVASPVLNAHDVGLARYLTS